MQNEPAADDRQEAPLPVQSPTPEEPPPAGDSSAPPPAQPPAGEPDVHHPVNAPPAVEPPAQEGTETAGPRPWEGRVALDVYSGPLDLLLYLIKRDEIDIQDIPISRITDEFVRYLDLFKEWNIGLAGDFIVMAATLVEIKSRMLLPEPPPIEEDDEEFEDPRLELVRQLMEYKRYKEAAVELSLRADERARRFARLGERPRGDEEAALPALGVDLWALVDAFQRVLAATGADRSHHVRMADIPQAVLMERLARRMQQAGRLRFVDLFEGQRSLMVLVGMFLALLELCKLFELRAEQQEEFGDIWMVYVPEDQRPIVVETVRPDAEKTFRRGTQVGQEALTRSLKSDVADGSDVADKSDVSDALDAEIAAVIVPAVPDRAPESRAAPSAPETPPTPTRPQAPPAAAPRRLAERRRWPRAETATACVRYRRTGLLGSCCCRYSPWYPVSDVSTGGLRFTSRRRVPLGARLCLQVRPSAGAGLIEIKGRVAWRRDMAALGRCDLAVTFDPDDASGPVPDVRERMLRQAAGGRAPAS